MNTDKIKSIQFSGRSHSCLETLNWGRKTFEFHSITAKNMPTECGVCLEKYQEEGDKCPKLLPCTPHSMFVVSAAT